MERKAMQETAMLGLPRHPAERPCIRLSVHLMQTYQHINMAFYRQQKREKSHCIDSSSSKQASKIKNPLSINSSKEKGSRAVENTHYVLTSDNETFNGRYQVSGKKMGKGAYGQVLSAIDLKTDRPVALKIIRKEPRFFQESQTEIEILQYLHGNEMGQMNHIVQLLDTFVHEGHRCLVFELLSYNLYELLRSTQFKGINLNLVRKFGKQLLESLRYLDLANIIHCDLKPENIVLIHPKNSSIKLIDFGNACKGDRKSQVYLQSRFYRSPEVLLGLPYNNGIDMWSLGCILAEILTGQPLFPGNDSYDQVVCIIKLLGIPPQDMIHRSNAECRRNFFNLCQNANEAEYYTLKRKTVGMLHNENVYATEEERKHQSICQALGVYSNEENGTSTHHYLLFVDLISKMLEYDIDKRIKPVEALVHPFMEFVKLKTRHRTTAASRFVAPGKQKPGGIDDNSVHRNKYRKLPEN